MVLRACRSIGVVLVLLLGGLVRSVASPAWACGCGAYVPDHPGASVADERALIAWDGATENILMSLSVAGSSDKAAWVMPVPYVGDAVFLTRWKNTIFDTASIDGDYVFEQAPSDSTCRQVIYRTRDRGDLTGLILLGVLGVGAAVILVVLVRVGL